MPYLYLLLRGILFALHILLGFSLAALLFVLRGKNWFKSIFGKTTIKLWMKCLAFILGIRISSKGRCVKSPALLVANHISWLDVIIIGSQCSTAFMAKLDVKQWPIIGLLASISGTLFVDRDSKKAISSATEKIQYTIQTGRSVVIFPEGTTTAGETIKPFKSSLYQAAVESGVAVQAIALQYPGNAGKKSHAPYIEDDIFMLHLLKIMKQPYTEANLSFCTPIHYQEKYTRKDLANLTERQVVRVNNNLLAYPNVA